MNHLRLQFAVLLFVGAFTAAAADYPTVAISDTQWPEGDGTSNAHVTFTLSEPYQYDILIRVVLGAPPRINDYWAYLHYDAGTCRIPAGETEGRWEFVIEGNDSYQSLLKQWPVETEYQIAGGPGGFLPTSGAELTITLTEDDPVPTVSLFDVTVTEPESGTYFLAMPFLPSGVHVTGNVAWRTIDVSASSLDYTPVSLYGGSPGPLYPPFYIAESPFQFLNLSGASMVFGIAADDLVEPDETFVIEFYDPYDLTLGRTQARVTIIDSDVSSLPVVSASDVTVQEGDDGVTDATITFTASEPVTGSFAWVTNDGGAGAETHDYQAGSGTVHFNNSTTATLTMHVYGDFDEESNENFFVRLSDPVDLQLATNTVAVNITDDDHGPAPVLRFLPAALMLYSGQSATVQAYLSTNGTHDIAVPLQVAGGAVDVPPSVFIPSGGSGELTVSATGPGGASIGCSGSVHCEPLPVEVLPQEIAGLAPRVVSTDGGTPVTIGGIGFSEGCRVAFGGVPGTITAIGGLETIHVITPLHTAGTVGVTVTCGAAATAAPSVEYVTPRRRAVRR
jgi:hypothetical protein